MKICIPTIDEKGWESPISDHFGRSMVFTIVDVETNELTVLSNINVHEGGQCQPPHFLADQGVNVLICKGLGRRALEKIKSLGIDVFIGATGTVQDAVNAFRQEQLIKASEDNVCGHHHGDHECHH